MVAVPPFQHSPMFGHCASSHTVASLGAPESSWSDSLRCSKRVWAPPGAGTWNHDGRFPGMGAPTFGLTGSLRPPGP